MNDPLPFPQDVTNAFPSQVQGPRPKLVLEELPCNSGVRILATRRDETGREVFRAMLQIEAI